MAIKVRDIFLAQVQDKADFIEFILDEYPSIYNEWVAKQDKKFRNEAELCSDGDWEIEESIYKNLSEIFDKNSNCKELFYQSMFLIAFAYYDGVIEFFRKEVSRKNIIDSICKKYNKNLSKEAKEALSFIEDEVKHIRHNICHNNMGTIRNEDKVKDLCKKYDGLQYENDIIAIETSDFIKLFLQKARILLTELCEITGHKVHCVNKYIKINTEL